MTRQDASAGATSGWTMAAVESHIAEAIDTLKRVPAPDIQRNVTRWPEFIRAARRAYVSDCCR